MMMYTAMSSYISPQLGHEYNLLKIMRLGFSYIFIKLEAENCTLRPNLYDAVLIAFIFVLGPIHQNKVF
jgi:hypothetical protein